MKIKNMKKLIASCLILFLLCGSASMSVEMRCCYNDVSETSCLDSAKNAFADIEKELKTSLKRCPRDTGLSTGAKVGIGVSVSAVVAAVAAAVITPCVIYKDRVKAWFTGPFKNFFTKDCKEFFTETLPNTVNPNKKASK